MSHAILVRITAHGNDWQFSVGDGLARPVEQIVSGSVFQGAEGRITKALSTVSPVAIPGKDARRTRFEGEAGQTLGNLLPNGSSSRLAFLLGQAEGRQETAVIVIDTADPTPRALPWELLALGDKPPLEALSDVIITRLAPGTARMPHPAASQLSTWIWCPDPQDPVCGRRLDALRETLRGLQIPHQDLDVKVLPDSEETTAVVVHLVCHGRRVENQVQIHLGEEQTRAPGTATHVLAPLLRRSVLVILDVCEAGDATPDELESLAGRIIASGAGSVVAPMTRSSLLATNALSEGLYRSLLAGSTVPEAVAAGRRQVRGLALPHPDSRWCNSVLYLSDLGGANADPPVSKGWCPSDWPRPAPDAASLLEAAYRLAYASSAGFVGLEHLVGALPGVSGGSTLCAQVRFAVSQRPSEWRRHLEVLNVVATRSQLGMGSPRLQRYGQYLSDGFDLEALWEVIRNDPTTPLREVLLFHDDPSRGGATLGAVTDTSANKFALATGFEVLGGPEDGRRLHPKTGHSIGRWSDQAQADLLLYATTPLIDPYLSRRHLVWMETGRIELLRSGDRQRGMTPPEPFGPGEVTILEGDILILTKGTRLRGVRDAAFGDRA